MSTKRLGIINERIRRLPLEFERKRNELDDLVRKHEALLELKPLSQQLDDLTKNEIPLLEANLARDQSLFEQAMKAKDEVSILYFYCLTVIYCIYIVHLFIAGLLLNCLI
ncbi:unnamed protein product [Protopolystoma xenopodis]|uniref:Uncharacterized protein n=1 Tax=Protopolystoma xenopodis TaxID=117903 RepID=A0A3S5BYX8_9PLAT|nr:unnamed protein product [Protopolystoma xenopodis]